jgi:hypothetical protein
VASEPLALCDRHIGEVGSGRTLNVKVDFTYQSGHRKLVADFWEISDRGQITIIAKTLEVDGKYLRDLLGQDVQLVFEGKGAQLTVNLKDRWNDGRYRSTASYATSDGESTADVLCKLGQLPADFTEMN